MTNFKVSAPSVGISSEFSYDFGENLQDAIQKFGEDVVFSLYRQQAVVRAQALVRDKLKAGASVEEAQKALAEWKPGAAPQRKSKIEKITSTFSGLSEEEKKAVLEKIKEIL